jgi:hypothetical protein
VKIAEQFLPIFDLMTDALILCTGSLNQAKVQQLLDVEWYCNLMDVILVSKQINYHHPKIHDIYQIQQSTVHKSLPNFGVLSSF